MELQEIKDALDSNKYKAEIEQAKVLQMEMQYFTVQFSEGKHPYQTKFEDYIKNRFNDIDSKNTFFTNTIYPLHTSSLANKINNELTKMFSGEDYHDRFVFKGEKKDTSIISDYTKKYLEKTWYSQFCTNPNDLVYCHKFEDKYRVKYISINNLLAIDFDIDCNIEYCICKINKDEMIVFDKTSTALYDSNSMFEISRYEHNTGICAIDFVSSVKYNNNNVIRKNHYYDYVGNLKRLQINATIQNIQDSMSFAHEFRYDKLGCGIKINGTQCMDGFLYYKGDPNSASNETELVPVEHPDIKGAIKPCPHCNNKSRSFGTIRTVSPPKGENNLNIIESLVKYLHPETSILEYKDKSIKEQEDDTFNSILGINETLNDNQQHNEMRVSSVYESRVNVINKWKSPAEHIFKFITTEILKFEHGDNYKKTYVNLGTKFYLLSESELIEKIETTDKNSLSGYTNYRNELICSKYQTDEEKKNIALFRLECENQIKKYKQVPVSDLVKMTTINNTDLYVNLNFDLLFCNFESEFINNNINLHEYLAEKGTQDVINDFKTYINKHLKDEEINNQVQVL